MKRISHNHGLDPSCNEHPTGDCIIQELQGKLDDIRLVLAEHSFAEYWGGQAVLVDDIKDILDRKPND